MKAFFYTKPNCEICELVRLDLNDLEERFGVQFVQRDIRQETTLFERFRNRVPVVELVPSSTEEQSILFEHPFSQAALRSKLKELLAAR